MKPLILAVVPALLLTATMAPADDSRSFGGWLATCRADDYCSATQTPVDEPAAASLHIGRPAQQSYWEIGVVLPAPPTDPELALTATIDGKGFAFAPPDALATFGDINDYYLLGRQSQRLLDALVHGKQLEIAFADQADEAKQASFSLDGLGAALLWIDTAQHRIGSERVVGPPPFCLPHLEIITGRPVDGPVLNLGIPITGTDAAGAGQGCFGDMAPLQP